MRGPNITVTVGLWGMCLSACLLPEVYPREDDAGADTRAPMAAEEPNERQAESAPVTTSTPSASPKSAALCALDNGGCDAEPRAQCEERENKVACICPSGYSGSGVGPNGCSDIDECAVNNGGCDVEPRATCENQVGFPPNCVCPEGSTGKGTGASGCMPKPVVSCGRYTCEADTVTDPKTGLIWQRALPVIYPGCHGTHHSLAKMLGETCAWQHAKAYCEQLKLGSATWRLPSIKELESIVEKIPSSPMLDEQVFPDTRSIEYWSATLQDSSSAWYVDFSDGTSHYAGTSFEVRVRCVH